MLHFFRTHQKYFYAVVTFIIVISFSFFGVMNSINTPAMPDPEVFVAVDGTSVNRSELERLAFFIGTDDYDKMAFGGMWGPNFLNDGVIPKDFLAAGLIHPIVHSYRDFLRPDYESRLPKEKRYELYHHPDAKFIGVENAWNYLAPEMKRHFDRIQSTDDPLAKESMTSRVQLYLGQRRLPPVSLKQVMKYQRNQYNWIPEDPNLDRADLSLFGYHTVEDWFGPRLTRLIAAVIIDVSKIAQQDGILVSDDEALASLIQQTHRSFEQNKNSPYMNVKNADQYLQEQLRRMRMDLHQAVQTWKKVLLFRRYFQEYGDTVLVDRLPFESFSRFANEYVAGDLYQLPEAVRLSSFRDLQQYEFYIGAVARHNPGSLAVPTRYRTPEEVAKKAPSFVQRRYRLDVAKIDSEEFESQVGTKEMWDWQLSDENWARLQKEFAALGTSEADDAGSRFAVLDELSPRMRERVDVFSRAEMIKQHPEWIEQTLRAAPTETVLAGLRLGGSDSPFEGIDNSKSLMALFDRALDGDREAEEALAHYTQDGRTIYQFSPLEAAPELEILTFAELKRDGSLDLALREALEEHYLAIREESPEKYQTPSGDWKPFHDVRDLVAKDYFSDVLMAVQERVQSDDPLTVDDAARYRFSEWMQQAKESIMEDPEGSDWVRGDDDAERSLQDLSSRQDLGDQWKLVKSSYRLSYAGEKDERIDRSEVFALEEGRWSDVLTPIQGDITFFQLKEKGVQYDQDSLTKEVMIARHTIAWDAQRALMEKTLNQIDQKQPIALNLFDQGE